MPIEGDVVWKCVGSTKPIQIKVERATSTKDLFIVRPVHPKFPAEDVEMMCFLRDSERIASIGAMYKDNQWTPVKQDVGVAEVAVAKEKTEIERIIEGLRA